MVAHRLPIAIGGSSDVRDEVGRADGGRAVAGGAVGADFRELNRACDAAKDGTVLGMCETLALRQGRELMRQTIEVSLHLQKSEVERKELVHHEHYRTHAEARHSLFKHIEVFYNRQRSHSALGYVSPAQFAEAL